MATKIYFEKMEIEKQTNKNPFQVKVWFLEEHTGRKSENFKSLTLPAVSPFNRYNDLGVKLTKYSSKWIELLYIMTMIRAWSAVICKKVKCIDPDMDLVCFLFIWCAGDNSAKQRRSKPCFKCNHVSLFESSASCRSVLRSSLHVFFSEKFSES